MNHPEKWTEEQRKHINKHLDGKGFFWINIYGAPVNNSFTDINFSSDDAELMNSNPELGSLFKGRLLMQVKFDKKES